MAVNVHTVVAAVLCSAASRLQTAGTAAAYLDIL